MPEWMEMLLSGISFSTLVAFMASEKSLTLSRLYFQVTKVKWAEKVLYKSLSEVFFFSPH